MFPTSVFETIVNPDEGIPNHIIDALYQLWVDEDVQVPERCVETLREAECDAAREGAVMVLRHFTEMSYSPGYLKQGFAAYYGDRLFDQVKEELEKASQADPESLRRAAMEVLEMFVVKTD